MLILEPSDQIKDFVKQAGLTELQRQIVQHFYWDDNIKPTLTSFRAAHPEYTKSVDLEEAHQQALQAIKTVIVSNKYHPPSETPYTPLQPVPVIKVKPATAVKPSPKARKRLEHRQRIRARRESQLPPKPRWLVTHDGQVEAIVNLSEYCRDHNLSVALITNRKFREYSVERIPDEAAPAVDQGTNTTA
jgi:hypothetical protein